MLLGISITHTIVNGNWPFTGSVALLAFGFHAAAIGVGQLVDDARLTGSDVMRVTAAGLIATAVAAIVYWMVA